MKKNIIILLILSLFVFSNCQTTNFKPDDNMHQVDNTESNKLLKIILDINSKSFSRLKADFSIKSRINDKPFNAYGKLYFINSPFKLKVSFRDMIFQSKLMDILMSVNRLETYLPIEKKVYQNHGNFSSDTISDFNLSPIQLSNFALGRIPLVQDYKIVSTFAENDKKDENLIILENNTFKQSIIFKNKIPEKIQLMNKRTKDSYEIFFYNPIKVKEGIFYKKIKAYSKKTRDIVEIKYKKLYFDQIFKTNSIFKLNIPAGTKYIRQ